jgi:hypothetical protein
MTAKKKTATKAKRAMTPEHLEKMRLGRERKKAERAAEAKRDAELAAKGITTTLPGEDVVEFSSEVDEIFDPFKDDEPLQEELSPMEAESHTMNVYAGSDLRPEHVPEAQTHDQIGHGHQELEEWEWGETWVAPAMFPEVEPRAGFENRWIAVEHQGKGADRNMNRKFKHWKPISVHRLPAGAGIPQSANIGSFGEVIFVQGMILCECPIRIMDQRREFIAKRGKKQRAATGSSLRKASEGLDEAAKDAYGEPQVYDKETAFTRAKKKPSGDRAERPEVAPD